MSLLDTANTFLNIPVIYWIIGALVLVALIALIVIIACIVHVKKSKAAANSSEQVQEDTVEETEEEQEEVTKEAIPAESKPNKPTTKTYHISKRRDTNMWQIKAAGAAKAIKLFKTQKEAIDYCKTLADNQDANIMIHKEDGSFRKLTY